jgi:hypothetical protein
VRRAQPSFSNGAIHTFSRTGTRQCQYGGNFVRTKPNGR